MNIIQSISAFVKQLIFSKHAYLIVFLILVLFNATLKTSALFLGDKDGHLSSNWQFVFFNINIFLGLLFTFLCFLKSKRINDIEFKKQYWYIIIFLAFIARLLMVQLGHNYDLESYEIVADLVIDGKNVYGYTERYNYAPSWSLIISPLKYLAGDGPYHQKIFHLFIVCILFISELFFCKLLYKQFKNKLLIVFLLLNPISIIIIGHHSQFDIICIVLAFWSYIQLKKGNIMQACIGLGLSLTIKHNMVFFPLLLLFENRILLKHRILYVLIPISIFIMSFIPYMNEIENIKIHVFSYQHNFNQTFLKQFIDILMPPFFTQIGPLKYLTISEIYKLIWIGIFPIIGYYLAKFKIEEKFLIYLILLVASALAISEQYLLIPLAAIFYYRKSFFAWIYLALSTYFLMFVSYNNTSVYFNLNSLGFDLKYFDYNIGYAIIQFALIALLFSIRLDTEKTKVN